MANEEYLEILKQGVNAWNRWREDNPDVRPDLSGADLHQTAPPGSDSHWEISATVRVAGPNLSKVNLSETNLSETNLWGVNLGEADLHEAELSGTNFGWTNLSEADLSGAYLEQANLSGANLHEAKLKWADLNEANLSRADLTHADLSRALLDQTILGDIDLSTAKGLEAVNHRGPSTIGIDTIYASKGKIPEAFLRGAGVPDTLIAQIPALIGALQPIEFYSCFISYSHKDEDFAKRLHSRMRDEHLRVWFAPEDMRAGRKVHEQIEEAIRYYDKLLLVLSEDSMDSQWVETEIYHARQREIKEKRRVLFPIRLVDFETIRDWTCFDADTGRDMAREIREYYVPDFSNWKDHDAFEEAFDRLLRDLKAEDEPNKAKE